MTEDQLEQETLGWLADTGYSYRYGLGIAPDGTAPERSNYSQVLLVSRLREAINRLNPLVPLVAREDALQQVLNLDTPVLLAANRAFHQLLVNGVSVEYQKDGETRQAGYHRAERLHQTLILMCGCCTSLLSSELWRVVKTKLQSGHLVSNGIVNEEVAIAQEVTLEVTRTE